ncbi:MAG: RluA family pseudouridine synthase [Holosporales bacterium]|jgi:23S rRNA pseudouridine1911/1915/1917 synthase|nr:RluA family pseudouridine synthase [Holosporales bacterium]
MREVKITEEDKGQRLDIVIAKNSHGNLSRSQLQKLLKNGKVSISGKTITDGSKKIQSAGVVKIQSDNIDNKSDISQTAENIPLDVVYEDEHLVVLNKEAGMVCHPAPGNYSGTLVNALLWHYKNTLSNIGEIDRPGIVHRLDKDTSGLMIIAKSNEVHRILASNLARKKGKRIIKKYKCFTIGAMNQRDCKIETFIQRDSRNRQKYTVSEFGGKKAITLCKTLRVTYITSNKPISLVECELLTGRTHQIRVHMKHIGCPIVGDPIYGKSKIENVYPSIVKNFKRSALHSYYLEFIHPITEEQLSFRSDFPNDMRELNNLYGTP